MNCYIIYEKYYDFINNRVLSGGIQTYLTELIPIIKSYGYLCYIYQMDTVNRDIELKDVKVFSIKTNFQKSYRCNSKKLLKCFESEYNDSVDLLLFATDTLICKNKASKSIAIQHGICWDTPCHTEFSPKLNSLYLYRKIKSSFRTVYYLSYAKKVVCVDYNFPNWYRAISAYEATPLTVIPNFAKTAPLSDKPKNKVNIIFARRFEWYRGTKVFAHAVKRILTEYPSVQLTIAGRGPDEQFLRDTLSKFGKQVRFTQYTSNESLAVHQGQHIAIIPTVGSEGTSLSLLEAMSSGCAAICTSVGGMTNIVIDGYNGLMVAPGDSDQLYLAIKDLIDHPDKRNRLAETGYKTVQSAFSYERWRERWSKILNEMQ